MKKKLFSLIIGTASFLMADCENINFGSVEQEYTYSFKDFKVVQTPVFKIISSDTLYVTKYKMVKNKEDKFEFLSFSDAYGFFYNEATKLVKEECLSKSYDGIVNFHINQSLDDKGYYFSATYDFVKKQ